MMILVNLSVHGGIPVGVVEDDGVRPGQVDADAAAPGRQDEGEDRRVAVAPLHHGLQCKGSLKNQKMRSEMRTDMTLGDLGGPIQTKVAIALVGEERLQDVQHSAHLGEDQAAVTAGLESDQIWLLNADR